MVVRKHLRSTDAPSTTHSRILLLSVASVQTPPSVATTFPKNTHTHTHELRPRNWANTPPEKVFPLLAHPQRASVKVTDAPRRWKSGKMKFRASASSLTSHAHARVRAASVSKRIARRFFGRELFLIDGRSPLVYSRHFRFWQEKPSPTTQYASLHNGRQ